MAHNEWMADIDWDGWLNRLVEDETTRRTADVRAYLIAKVSRAMDDSDALVAGDADQLAEVAMDAIIESTRNNHIRPI